MYKTNAYGLAPEIVFFSETDMYVKSNDAFNLGF